MNRTLGRIRPQAMSLAAIATAAALLVSACGSGDDSADSSAGTAGATSGTMQLKIADFPVMELAALFAGQDEGDFAKQGVTLKTVQISGAGAAMLPALQSGTIDIAPSNVLSVMQANAQGQDVKCFAAITRRPATGRPLALIASPKANITSAADLKGKSLAVNALGGANDLIMRVWLTSQGVDPKSVKFVATNLPDMPQVLSSGAVAAALVDEPYTTIAVQSGDKVLAERPYQAVADTPLFSCWAATSKTIKNNAKALQAFVTAMAQANDSANSDRALVTTTLVKDMQMDQKVAAAASVPQFDTTISDADLKVWADDAKKYGLLAKSFDPAAAVDTSITAK